MKSKLLNLTILSLILLIACDKESTNSTPVLHSIKGRIVNSSGPVKNVKIAIDNSINWTTYTSDHGNFQIDNVSEGQHLLKIEKEISNGGFMEKSETISVVSDLDLGSLYLPNPVLLKEPINVTTNSIEIVWESTNAEDFFEYKIFRRDNPGLDETTGELIYVSTSVMDTSFIDTELYSNNKYYYRVYVMNNIGRLGGSNIINSTTLIGNLLFNGDFESENNISEIWDITGSGSAMLDSIIVKEGLKSLHIETPYSSTGSGSSLFSKAPIFIEPNVEHEFAGWFKLEGRGTDLINMVIQISQGQNYLQQRIIFDSGGGIGGVISQDWVKQNFSFSVNSIEPIKVWILCTTEDIWIDDLSIIPK